MLNQLSNRLRSDVLPILLFVVAMVIMTYPLVFVMHEQIPMNNADTNQAIWMNWWAVTALENGYDINQTSYLFAPNGLDLTLFPPRWTQLPIWIPLYKALGEPLAYNLMRLIGLMIKAYGMYLLGLYLFKNRTAAWVAGAFYAFGSAPLQKSLPQPLTGSTEWLPFFMLTYVYAIDLIRNRASLRKTIPFMLLAAIIFNFSVYINLKIGIFAMLLGGGYVLLAFVWHKLWQYRNFWISMIVFGAVTVALALPILFPVVKSENLDNAIDSVLEGMGIDIVNYVKPMENRPLNYMPSIAAMADEYVRFNDFTILDTPYVGIVAIVFALMGVQYAIRIERRVLIWLIIAIVFLLMSFGLEWMWNGQYVGVYWTPIRLLKDNVIVVIIKWMYRWSLIFWLPFSLLIGYGLLYRMRSLTMDWKQVVLLVMSVVMLLYGTSIFPIRTRLMPVPDYVDFLNTLPEGDIMNLPLGRQESKYYMVVQIQHERAINEGAVARLPSGSYDFHKLMPLTSILRGREPLWEDQDAANEGWHESMQVMLDNGFRYLVLHNRVQTKGWKPTQQFLLDLFKDSEPIYSDDLVKIFDIEDLLSTTPRLPE